MKSLALLHVLTAYTDFFPKRDYCNSRFKYNFDPYDVDIRDCMFANYVVNGVHGGVIYIACKVHIVVESCTISNIALGAGFNGGSIHITGSSSGFAISKTCTYRSYTTSGIGHFMYLQLSSTDFLFNTDTSIIQCAPTLYGTTQSPLYCQYGYQSYTNMNLSNNVAYQFGSMNILNAANYSLLFSTIANNNGTNRYCLRYGTIGQNPMNKYLNYVNNSTPHTTTGNIDSSNHVFFELCIFLQNFRILFSGSATISSCYISHTTSLQTTGSNVQIFSTNNVILDDGFWTETYQFTHYASAFCEIPTPAQSKEPTPDPQGAEITPCQTIPEPPTECNVLDPAQLLIPYKFISHVTLLTLQMISQ